MKKAFAFVSLLIFSCAPVRVSYDFDKTVNFSDFTTYNYFQNMDTGLSQLDEKRLLKVLDSMLLTKGKRLAEAPEFLVNIKSEVYRSAPGNTVGVGVGGGGRNVGGGVSVGIPLGASGLKRNIILDIVDAQRNQLIWQADTESGFRDNASPSVREDILRNVVHKALGKFPPQRK